MSAPTTAPTRRPPLPFVGKACLAAPLLALVLGLAFAVAPVTAATVPAGIVRILLLMAGFTFAFVALFGMRRPGSERLARCGRAGLIINGVYLFLSAVQLSGSLASTRAYLAHHPAHALSVSARESSLRSEMKSGGNWYANLDFNKPAEALAAVVSAAPGRTGEDAAVLHAWSGVLTQLLAARLAVEQTEQALNSADVLNPATITNGSRMAVGDQFIARRVLANRYSSALYCWEHTLTAAVQNHVVEMKKQQVSPERIGRENQALAAVAGSRIKPLIKLCVAEQQVANHFNRAISAMESCHPFNESNNLLSPKGGVPGKDFKAELTKLEHAEQLATNLRQELSGRR